MAYWRGNHHPEQSAPGQPTIDALMNLLARQRELRPALWGDILHEQAQMITLTEEQFFVLDVLSRHRQAAIAGCAGSGKTLLAVEKASRLARQGFRVLLTCFNRNLAVFLRQKLGDLPNLHIESFHKLCFDLAREADLLPVRNSRESRFFNVELPQLMHRAAKQLGIKYDAIIVDEGQDFRPNWWSPLQSLLAEPNEDFFYIFYDDNQSIYTDGDIADTLPIDQPPYTLTINCRNTKEIHQQVSRFYRAPTETTARGPLGRPISVARYSQPHQLQATLSDTLQQLIRDERVPANEIAILTPLSRRKSQIWASSGFQRTTFSDNPSQLHTDDTIVCNTIHAFKGLESSVVILAELDQWRSRDLNSLLYVACSRARNHLIVLLPETAPSALQRQFN